MQAVYWEIIVSALAGYIFGSISTAIVVCKCMGLPDPRDQGSKNPGATNVLRIGGKKAAFLTLVGDALKGTIPVVAVYLLINNEYALAATGFAAFIGHLYPIFFGFKGGKGVATALGVLLGWSFWIFAATGLTWLAMAKMTKISSLSALIAFTLAPLYMWVFTGELSLASGSIALTATIAVMSAMLFWRHRSNIRNIINGEEKKIGQKG